MTEQSLPRHRRIRSYVLRGGRSSAAQARAFEDLWPRYGVGFRQETTLNPADLFGNEHPVYLEIGFGKGDTLVEFARNHPQRNYLGIEVHRPGISHLLRKLEEHQLGNVRVLQYDAMEILTQGIEEASLHGVYLLFPDPWPKKKHHKRRIVQPTFANAIGKSLVNNGLLHMATDWQAYADHMRDVLEAEPVFENLAGRGNFSPRPASRPLTRFEQRGQRLGHQTRELIYRRLPRT